VSLACAYRIDCGQNYAIALAEYLGGDWLNGYRKFAMGGMVIWEKFALIHPLHAGERGDPSCRKKAWDSVQGLSTFVPKRTTNARCQADVVWGYPCPITGENMEQDHLFPHSLGGVTKEHNRIWLCRYHNMLKGNDVHCYPWEEEAIWASWLDRHIEAIHRQVFLNQP